MESCIGKQYIGGLVYRESCIGKERIENRVSEKGVSENRVYENRVSRNSCLETVIQKIGELCIVHVVYNML